MVYVFLADGFEECEALAPVDILRRGGIDVTTVGVGSKSIKGAHGITVLCDCDTNCIPKSDLTAVILPGGMPGTLNLEKNETVIEYVKAAAKENRIIGAICAAPSILGHIGLLKGKKATCFGGFEKDLKGASVDSTLPVVTDGNIVTAYGAGAAFDFGFALLTAITKDRKKTEELMQSMRYKNK